MFVFELLICRDLVNRNEKPCEYRSNPGQKERRVETLLKKPVGIASYISNANSKRTNFLFVRYIGTLIKLPKL